MPNFVSESSTLFDPEDPNPWLAVSLDKSVPINSEAKQAWLRDCSSGSRQFLLPFIRPLARITIVSLQILKTFLPKKMTFPKALHTLLVFCLKNFARKEANWLILRHFHAGSEILEFLSKNIAGTNVPTNSLKPRNIGDLGDCLFMKHDINLFNFVIRLNQQLRDKKLEIEPIESLDFSMITDADFDIEMEKMGMWNLIDLETAIELFTPCYQLFLSDDDFWRATNSLQLDESIAIYAARVLQRPEIVSLVNNKHPLAQQITISAAWRLVLHGLATENLHGLLVQMKREAEAQSS